MQQPIIETRDLKYSYPDGTKALNGIDLKVYKGEKLAIMGSNGSGKSTLFLNLNGVYKCTDGEILIDGQPIDYSRKGLINVRKKIGIVFQEPDNQLFCSSVLGEISFGVLNLGYDTKTTKERVYSIMDTLNITPFKDKPVHALSGGQKKKVSIADILVMQPDVIILDEPTSSLDDKSSSDIDDILTQMNNMGITIILSTHSSSRCLSWADRLIILDNGYIIADGKPQDIFINDEILKQTNISQPDIVKIYKKLISKGIIDSSISMPKSANELIKLI